MSELRQTAARLCLQLLVVALVLCPTFIYAQKQSILLPQKYANLKTGDVNSLQQMLKEGISVNAVDEKGNSLLMLAAYQGDMKKVKFLIDAGADINQRNEKNILTFGDTPMDYAIRGYQREIVDLFLSLNVDVNAKFRKATSTIYKCGMTRNYKMLDYLLQKGVVVSDEDKINTMLISFPRTSSPVSQESRQIIQILLRDLQVNADDLWASSLIDRDNMQDRKKVKLILDIQESYENTKKQQLAEQRKQDSLKQLLESGQADTIRYIYTEGMVGRGDTWRSKITVTPRVDFVENQQGDKSSAVYWILIGLTILVVYYCCQQIVSHVYKERPTYLFPYIAIYLIGGWVLYSIFSCVYRNLDDIMVRKQGEEKIAVLNTESSQRQYKHRGQYHTYYITDHHFVFTGNDSIRIAVNQGNTRFDADDYTEEESKHIKVRYDSASHKLSVDNDKYFMQNLIRISFMFLLLLLIFMFCWGIFNGVLDAIQRKLLKAVGYQNKPIDTKSVEYRFEPTDNFQVFEEDSDSNIDTYWTFTSKEYLSKDDFIRDVQRSEKQNGAESDERIRPDKIMFECSSVKISPSDDYIIGEEDFCIEITPDNGINITEGELLFKLHNQMIPYLDKLSEHDIGVVLGIGCWENSNIVVCTLMFQSELEGGEKEE